MPLGIDAPVTSANLPSNDIETSFNLIFYVFLATFFSISTLLIHGILYGNLTGLYAEFWIEVKIFCVQIFFRGNGSPEFPGWFGEAFFG
jgi:hypothetical protein